MEGVDGHCDWACEWQWVSEWAREWQWVNEWVSEWVSEWVRVGGWSRETRPKRSLHRKWGLHVDNDLLLLSPVCHEESLEIVCSLQHHVMKGRVITHDIYITNTRAANCKTWKPVWSPRRHLANIYFYNVSPTQSHGYHTVSSWLMTCHWHCRHCHCRHYHQTANRKPARPRHTSCMLARALSSGMTQSICPLAAARNNGGNVVYKHTMILTHSTGALASLVWHSLRFWGWCRLWLRSVRWRYRHGYLQ